MPPEQVREALLAVDGIKAAEVKRSKKGKFKSLELQYTHSGVPVGDMSVTIEPIFKGEALTDLNLVTPKMCTSVGIERLKELRNSLSEKYRQSVREKVVDENGVEIGQQLAFWNDETRVRLSYQIENPSLSYTSPNGGKTMRALAGLANALAEQNYQAAMSACPNDNGATVVLNINYSSQAVFLKQYESEARAREEKAQSLRKDL